MVDMACNLPALSPVDAGAATSARRRMQDPDSRKLLVLASLAGSPAARAGILPGDEARPLSDPCCSPLQPHPFPPFPPPPSPPHIGRCAAR